MRLGRLPHGMLDDGINRGVVSGLPKAVERCDSDLVLHEGIGASLK